MTSATLLRKIAGLRNISDEDRRDLETNITCFTGRFLNKHGVEYCELLEIMDHYRIQHRGKGGVFICFFDSPHQAIDGVPTQQARPHEALATLPPSVRDALTFASCESFKDVTRRVGKVIDMTNRDFKMTMSQGALIVTSIQYDNEFAVSWISCYPKTRVGYFKPTTKTATLMRSTKSELFDTWIAMKLQEYSDVPPRVAQTERFLALFGIRDYGFNHDDFETLKRHIVQDIGDMDLDIMRSNPVDYINFLCQKYGEFIKDILEDCEAVCPELVKATKRDTEETADKELKAGQTFVDECLHEEKNRIYGPREPCLVCGHLNYNAPYKCQWCFASSPLMQSVPTSSSNAVALDTTTVDLQVKALNASAAEKKKMLRTRASKGPSALFYPVTTTSTTVPKKHSRT